MTVFKYKKVSLTIEAVQFDGQNFKECEQFLGLERYDNTLNYPNVKTIYGTERVSEGDYILKEGRGDFQVAKEELFEANYYKVAQ